MESEEPPQWGGFPIGPVEARVMLALIYGIAAAVPQAFRDAGRTDEARDAWMALKSVNGPEYDAVMTYAAAVVLPRVMEAIASGTR